MLIPVIPSYTQTEIEFQTAVNIPLNQTTGSIHTATLVTKIKGDLIKVGGSVIRVYFGSPTSLTTSVLAAYIGPAAASGSAPSFASTPTEITVDGNGAFNLSNELTFSDIITFDLEMGTSYCVAVAINASKYLLTADNYLNQPGVFPGYTSGGITWYRKSDVNEASTIVKSGYNTSQANSGAICAGIVAA
jgi:hypothetical protein